MSNLESGMAAEAPPKPVVASTAHHVETVLWVKHWTDTYFSFAITRPSSFRFRSGEFVMIGLPTDPCLGQRKGQAGAAGLFDRQPRPGPTNWSSSPSRSRTAL